MHLLDFLAVGAPRIKCGWALRPRRVWWPLAHFELEFLNSTGCQFRLGTFMDGLRHQNFTGCCRRLRWGREIHNSPDCSQVAMRAAEFPEAEFSAVDSDAYPQLCAAEAKCFGERLAWQSSGFGLLALRARPLLHDLRAQSGS